MFRLTFSFCPAPPGEASPVSAPSAPPRLRLTIQSLTHRPKPVLGPFPESIRVPFSRQLHERLQTHRRTILMVSLLTVIAGVLYPFMISPNSADKTSGGGAWAGVRRQLSERAAIQVMDDFRSGLDAWAGTEDALKSWSFDPTGFVQPERMGILRPSLGLSDYTMEFLGQIDRRALTWIFRARDSRNYYVAKLMIAQPGPLPAFRIRRYAVLGGKETPSKDTVLPLTVRGDAMFQVRLEAHGPDFSIRVQDKLVDFWTDSRLPSGGVGFFCPKGESSRIRWVRFYHQYDVLGRICAFLSPATARRYDLGSNGSWK